MVQTQASAAGTLSSVIFILPGLLMIGYWNSFPFWQTLFICSAGGMLGVVFSIPLRHAMVVKSKLPYPEGVAAAEILKAGCDDYIDENDRLVSASHSSEERKKTAAFAIFFLVALLPLLSALPPTGCACCQIAPATGSFREGYFSDPRWLFFGAAECGLFDWYCRGYCYPYRYSDCLGYRGSGVKCGNRLA